MRIRSAIVFLIGSALIFGGILMRPRAPEQAPTTFEEMFRAATADAAQTDYFLKIEGVDGESKNDKHKNEIEVLSWSWGASNPGVQGNSSGASKFSDIAVVKNIDKASPQLFLKAAKGEHLPRAVLYVPKPGNARIDYFTIELQDVLISSYQAGAGSTLPTESVSLNFSKIIMTYVPQNADGSLGDPIHTGWDVGLNKEI